MSKNELFKAVVVTNTVGAKQYYVHPKYSDLMGSLAFYGMGANE